MKLSVSVRVALLALTCAAFMLAFSSPAWATHNRSTQLSWAAGAEAGEVHFEINFVARRSYYGSPEIEDTIEDPLLAFGDGQATVPTLTVTAIDGDTIYTHGEATHTYVGLGPYTASIGSCCRLSATSGHVNNGDLNYQVHTLVNLEKANSSPQIAVAPIVFCPTAGNCSFAFSGSGADPGNHLQWRLATPTETGDPFFVQPGPPFAPNAATIDPTMGRVTWDTTGATVNSVGPTYYSIQVIAEELNSQDETISDAAGDFFIALDDNHIGQPDCVDTNSNGLVDDDADGLCDNWETDGIDVDDDGNVDISLPEADPEQQDVFVEIDYMKGRKPQSDALQDVAKAFAAHGISLHFFVDEEVPFAHEVVFGSGCSPSCPSGTVDFDDVKESYFGASGDRASVNHQERLDALRFAYHYILYANELPGNQGYSGRAELPGNDLTVTLGSWRTSGGSGPPVRRNESGTLMHELGHNLSLQHGGGDSVNCKPNYLSVMNYTRQTTAFISPQLDYSDAVLPALDEADLNELLGVQGPSGAQVVYGPGSHIGGSTGAIDWNGTGGLQSSVSADVNQVHNACGASPGETLVGWDDWDNLALAFQATADFSDGVHSSVLPQEPEVAAEDVIDLDDDGDGVPNIKDACTGVGGPSANAGCPLATSETTPAPRSGPAPSARPGPPDTLLRNAKLKARRRSVRFTFAGSGGASSLSFQCRLDHKPFKPCRSPKGYSNLTPGSHVFRVRAVDALGQVDPTPAVKRFAVAAAKPPRGRK